MRKVFWQKNGNRWVRILLIIFFVITVLVAAFTMFVESFLRPIFLAAAEQTAIQKVTDAMSQAVLEHAKKLRYTDLIHYQTNNQGDIILMQPDLQVVNEFIAEVTLTIHNNMGSLKEEEIRIPVAQALGFQVLAALGPRMSVQMIPLGVIQPPKIVDTFETAGINQTRHKIYMQVTAEVQILVPFVHKRLKVETEVPVTEVLIMGKVPQVQIGIDGGILRKWLGTEK